MSDPSRELARSFGPVAETYDRARPSYPAEAAEWLVGTAHGDPKRVLELGAGTGKFTELLVAAGHHVIATDPLPEMLGYLKVRVPGAETMVATAEHLPVPSRSIDVVVAAQSFHWFDHDVALAEIARVLRPGGTVGLVWNVRDNAIPWVRKLSALIENGAVRTDTADPLRESVYFDEVAEREYRFWQDLRRSELDDLVRSRSNIAVMPEHARADVLARVGALYDDYGRGPDGMKLPYLTRCYKTTVTSHPPEQVVMSRVVDDAIGVLEADTASGSAEAAVPPPAPGLPAAAPPEPSGHEDTGTLLINFR
ncbi:MAG: class I SAM-dependent methyltransferase [Propionibacteriales bacterium]|nr:class I SAM-dependent methyltransferase [Propionibacteriales bacterium]